MVALRPPKRALRGIPKLPSLRNPEASTASTDGGSFRLSRGMRILFGAGATSLVAALIIGSFSASGVIDMTLAAVLLAASWLIGVGAIAVSEPLLGLPKKARWPVTIITAVVLAGAITGIGFYESAHFPAEKPKEGARLWITGTGIKKGDSKVTLNAVNKGDLDARVWANGSTNIVVADHMLSEKEEDEWVLKTEKALPLKGTGGEFLKGDSHRIDLELGVSDAHYDAIIAGQIYLYVFFVTAFTDSTVKPGTHLTAEFCGKYYKTLDVSTVCLGHNETRVSR
jgi:hypothetical protein